MRRRLGSRGHGGNRGLLGSGRSGHRNRRRRRRRRGFLNRRGGRLDHRTRRSRSYRRRRRRSNGGRRRCSRLNRGRLFCGTRRLFAGRRSNGRPGRRGGLDHYDLRGRRAGGTRNDSCCGSLGNHRTGGRPRSDGGRGRRRDDGRGGARRGYDFARLGARGHGGRGSARRRRRGLWLGLGCGRGRRFLRQAAAASLFFLFLLFCQHRLEGIAGLGYVRQVDLRRNCLRVRSARLGLGSTCSGASAVLKASTHFGRFIFLERTGVRLSRAETQFRQHVENLAALDLQLACQIVDSNLAHPPLFKFCYPKPARRGGLPRGIGCWFHFHYYRKSLCGRQRNSALPSRAPLLFLRAACFAFFFRAQFFNFAFVCYRRVFNRQLGRSQILQFSPLLGQ